MSEGEETVRGAGGCGCAAATSFMALIGLPILLIFSFGMSPCANGPCNPNGARNFQVAAAVLAGLAGVIGIGIWALVRWWDRRQPPGGIDRGRKRLVFMLTLPLLAVAAALTAFIWL